jgi:transaldolase/glucose-6-phosphate isomerase
MSETPHSHPPNSDGLVVTRHLGATLERQLNDALEQWRLDDKDTRLWARDATLWSGTDEAKWLGWLDIVAQQRADLGRFVRFAEDTRQARFTDILLLGMGGSSLCPEVLSVTFGPQEGGPHLHVLDSTDPAQVKAFEEKIDLAKTLFIVSSKSGSTLEPNIFKQYFFDRLERVVGKGQAGAHFVAITDPGSKLEKVAREDGFRHVFHGLPSIGGRYSALSDFGMIPAAAMGIDVARLLDRASGMVEACSPRTPVEENPGVVLGLILGLAAGGRRDKLTLVASPPLYDLGAWLEQLVAESTGKEGKGLIPVDREPLGPPAVYGDDRLFVYLRLEDGADAAQELAIQAVEEAGHPVVRLAVRDAYDLGTQFFLWEIATAVAGSALEINPFNQPDVEVSKIATRSLTDQYEAAGKLPEESPFAVDNGIALFADQKNTEALQADGTLAGVLKAHLAHLGAGDYFALLGYIEMNPKHEAVLASIRTKVRDTKHVATCVGFGPRFLHSTGQAYKGGPDSGVFLQITCDDPADLAVPGQTYSFGVVKAAQARGDFQVLAERGRRTLRVHLGPDLQAGLKLFEAAAYEALG